MEPNVYYAIQPAFTGGEVSQDVASRVDLDKYQLSLLQAENAIIRPYGAVRKRPGSIYCGTTKNNGYAILQRFEFSSELDYMLEFGAGYLRIWRDGQYIGVDLQTPYQVDDLEKLRFVQSVDVMYICSGKYPVKKLSRYTEQNWTFTNIDWTRVAYGDINMNENLTITPSATTGTITLTASDDVFTDNNIGDSIKIEQYVAGKSVAINASQTTTSTSIQVGKTWKVISHGTWTGTLEVQVSYDGGSTWKMLRSYTSNGDYNPTESGDVEDYADMRLSVTITSGTIKADLSAYPYNHTGYADITAVTGAREAIANVSKILGDTSATNNWYLSAWSAANGYPNTVTFFQDRLVFGGSRKYPQRVWMSKTGDYENFEVVKESGSITDDSAVTIDLLSQKACTINHLDVGNDLIVMTEGNLWTIAGSETVTPTNITPRQQENYGTNNVIPVRVGSRVVYVQRRGSIIRDTGYHYDTDSYVGQDLTILAKHLIKGRTIKDAAYAQEPDSMIYFVTSDGQLICLTYVPEQKVYGWSHFVTDGEYTDVCAIASGNNDVIYAVVKRTIDGSTKYYIEQFDKDKSESVSQQDYCMMDAATIINGNAALSTVTGLSYLEGKEVFVIGDGYLFDTLTVQNGALTLPQAAKRIVVGLPYTEILEQPNWDAGNTPSGTVQGRKKQVTTAILRLSNSFGGKIGRDAKHLNEIIYDSSRLELGEDVLCSGDIKASLGRGGFDANGRTFIVHDTPYPFSVSAIIREVTFGG